MDNIKLANLLFGDVDKTPEYYEKLYPERELKQGARVTRFAPSPTGFLHIGGLFAAFVSKLTAQATDGIFYLRIEDTDKKREVKGGVGEIVRGLTTFGVTPDEGRISDDEETGEYGPYIQSSRREIYRCFAKELTAKGLAYPCFCSEEELARIRLSQENEPVKGYYGKYARCRELSFDEIERRVKDGQPWVLRLRSMGDAQNRVSFDDAIKGKIDMPENIMDIVLLKTDGIPTYHFAHCVDDHLMRTTHIVRGDEWIASVPVHLQLFRYCGFKPPKYAHIAPIMKEEGTGKRKLSKRNDPEAAVSYYDEMGYPAQSVREYLLTLANSSFEQWRKANKTEPQSSFPFNLKKMSVSGALFDLVKLDDVSKNVIAGFDADTVYELVSEWAEKYDRELYEALTRDSEYAKKIFSLGRGGKKPRKDFSKWSEVKDYVAYFYTEFYKNELNMPENVSAADAAEIIRRYSETYNPADDKDEWFGAIKSICEPLGYTPSVKDYKAQPDRFKGHVGDVSTVIRIAVTGRQNTPDLYDVMNIIGEEEIKRRLKSAYEKLNEKAN